MPLAPIAAGRRPTELSVGAPDDVGPRVVVTLPDPLVATGNVSLPARPEFVAGNVAVLWAPPTTIVTLSDVGAWEAAAEGELTGASEGELETAGAGAGLLPPPPPPQAARITVRPATDPKAARRPCFTRCSLTRR